MKQTVIFLLVIFTLAGCGDKKSNLLKKESFNLQTISNLIGNNLDELPLFFINGMGDDHNSAIANSINDAKHELKKYNEENDKTFKIIDIDVQGLSYDPQVLKYVAIIKIKVSL